MRAEGGQAGLARDQGLFKLKRRVCAGQGGWDSGDGVTLPGEQAIKCAAWASRPLVSGPGHYMGSCLPRGTRTAKTMQQDRTGRPISAEILLERKKKGGERGQTLQC